MTSEEIIAVVDALCEKLGLAVSSVSELVPELAAWKIGIATLGIFVALLILVASAILTAWAWHKVDEDETYSLLFICSGIFAGCAFLVMMINVVGLIGWAMAPNIKAIEYVLSLVG